MSSKRIGLQLYDNNNPKTNIIGTGYKDVKTVKKTINLISKRSIIYQKSVMNTMYNRGKHHANKTPDMIKAIKYIKQWLIKNNKKKYKYEYLNLATIKKYENLANKLNVSKVSRGKSKASKTENGFLVMYKKYGKAKMPFIPIKQDPTKGDYDIFREKYLNARLGQIKKGKIEMYDNKGVPTRMHLTLIMNAYSPDKKLYK